MTGRLIAVVGPSGAGKDTLIAALVAARPDLTAVRRVITRPASPESEPFEGVTEDEFDIRVASGAFCLSWGAHGLRYGIPLAALRDVEAGADRLCNLSRGVLTRAAEVFPTLLVLNVTASPETLAARLSGRGRETADDIRARLARKVDTFSDTLDVVTIRNDGALGDAVAQALLALQPVRA